MRASDATTIDATQTPGGGGERARLAYLVIRQPGRTQVIDVDEGADILLGRSAEATAQLDDARASREHARVRRRGDAITLIDLGGRNGTEVNGEALRGQERTISSGDVIRIGHVEIVVAQTTAVDSRTRAGARLPVELARLRAAGGATLLRVEGERRALDDVPALADAVLVEAQADGSYACLFADAAAGERAADALRARGVRVTRQADEARPAVAPPVDDEDVVVADPKMQRVFELVRKVARTPTTVLILGETGVGKEVVAEQIHEQSTRARGPLVRLNCGSLPPTLLESELFGHEKGAFTGADKKKLGHLDAADGGTLFLDEVGELTLPMQVRLLRVLESRAFMRVGGRVEIEVDVRIVAATNRDLEAEVRAGRFREDLYFRLAAFTIEIPPLRDRPADLALLTELFVRRFAARLRLPPPTIAADAMAALARHAWPGNVRELRNAIERALVLADGGVLRAEHLPDALRSTGSRPDPRLGVAMPDQVADVELRAIEAALAAEKGNQTRAAKRLGISRRALIYKMSKYDIGRKSP